MSKIWSKERIKNAIIGLREGEYEAIAKLPHEIICKLNHPELFKFKAISIGDNKGQAFIVPLDESSKETAEFILRAIKAYQGE